MKKYFDNFRQYQFLLSELVKKGIKLEIPSFLSRYFMVYAGAFAHHDRSDNCIRNLVRKYRQNFPCIHSVRTSFVQLLFIRDQNHTEIHTVQFRYD